MTVEIKLNNVELIGFDKTRMSKTKSFMYSYRVEDENQESYTLISKSRLMNGDKIKAVIKGLSSYKGNLHTNLYRVKLIELAPRPFNYIQVN